MAIAPGTSSLMISLIPIRQIRVWFASSISYKFFF